MAKRNKYEVVDYERGGFFVHGGNLHETYFKRKEDADQVCAALNMMERLKTHTFQRKLDALAEAARVLDEALKDGTEYDY